VKYRHSIADAMAELGRPEEIGELLIGFQRHLYSDNVAQR
jgi:type I restriction enzyme R subunit